MNREQNQSLIPYRNNLNGVSRQRYLEKIHSLNGLDPYEHIEWTNDLNELPEVTLPDVFGYLVCGVLHSQCLNETPLKLWVVISTSGQVDSAQCTCMAGIEVMYTCWLSPVKN
ncbi:hypothetical protein ATANTOWER_024946 [Ataeniobius toweri]|uniref:Uncharacterized protein n=1 Tax=Ataeniobius toweri TaxID=208326 RepID=A0ABU7C2H0_9TELE|nr:hypothetical protein [Ataeniobius toweri]